METDESLSPRVHIVKTTAKQVNSRRGKDENDCEMCKHEKRACKNEKRTCKPKMKSARVKRK